MHQRLAQVCVRLGMPVEYISGLDAKMAADLIAYERKRREAGESQQAFGLRGWRDLVQEPLVDDRLPPVDLRRRARLF